MKTLVKLFNECAGTRLSAREVWGDAITMFACAISNAVDSFHYSEREALYLKTIQKYSADERGRLIQFCAEVMAEMDKNPKQDLLGATFEELGFCNVRNGQFFTPYGICVAMAKISCGDVLQAVQEKGYCSINDPTCGAGATLIASVHEAARALKGQYNWQDHILVTGQDTDWTVALMCYIQLSLLGAAGYFKIGDSPSDPMREGDKLDNYWFTPMYSSRVWTFRKLFAGRDLL